MSRRDPTEHRHATSRVELRGASVSVAGSVAEVLSAARLSSRDKAAAPAAGRQSNTLTERVGGGIGAVSTSIGRNRVPDAIPLTVLPRSGSGVSAAVRAPAGVSPVSPATTHVLDVAANKKELTDILIAPSHSEVAAAVAARGAEPARTSLGEYGPPTDPVRIPRVALHGLTHPDLTWRSCAASSEKPPLRPPTLTRNQSDSCSCSLVSVTVHDAGITVALALVLPYTGDVSNITGCGGPDIDLQDCRLLLTSPPAVAMVSAGSARPLPALRGARISDKADAVTRAHIGIGTGLRNQSGRLKSIAEVSDAGSVCSSISSSAGGIKKVVPAKAVVYEYPVDSLRLDIQEDICNSSAAATASAACASNSRTPIHRTPVRDPLYSETTPRMTAASAQRERSARLSSSVAAPLPATAFSPVTSKTVRIAAELHFSISPQTVALGTHVSIALPVAAPSSRSSSDAAAPPPARSLRHLRRTVDLIALDRPSLLRLGVPHVAWLIA